MMGEGAAGPCRDGLAALAQADIDHIRAMRIRGGSRGAPVMPWPDMVFRLAQAGLRLTVEELQRICARG
jgi:hypothetical protein